MEGSGTTVPPIGFAGILPLTDVLAHLPLPTPLPERFGTNQSLIFHPRIAAEAEPLLESSDPNLASDLVALLRHSNFDHVILKDEFQNAEALGSKDDVDDVPNLLKAILALQPKIFHDKTNAADICSSNGSLQNLPTSGTMSNVIEDYSPPGGNIPEPFRHMFPHKAFVRLESLSSSGPQRTFATPPSFARASKFGDDATRKKIISIGKQPKAQAQNRKKKDMVSELFDSLTPGAEYFGDRTRRRRTTSRLCADDVNAKVNDSVEEDNQNDASNQPMTPEFKDFVEDQDGKISPAQIAKEDEEWREIMKRRKEKVKRRSMRSSFVDPKEVAENETYKKFMSAIDTVFDNVEDCDLAVDDEEIPSECLISKAVVSELASESAKLRMVGFLNKVPVERLTKLMNILERNMKDGINLSIGIDEKLDDGMLLELHADRVFRSLDAASVALTVMTGHNMPRQVYIEDAIERAAQLLKFQLVNTVAPTFDPTYRMILDCENDASSKSKRFKSQALHGGSFKGKIIHAVYTRLIDLVGNFADLVPLQTLPENTVILLCSFGVTSFFIENLREFQLSALRLLSNIFNRYETCRKMILEEILASLARSPNSRKSSRNYKVSFDESIQMMSALILQLVQSAVHVPSADSKDDEEDDEGKHKSCPSSLDVGAVTISTYDRTVGTAHTFLNAYLNKCRTKSEEDYRPLFEAFVEDLLLVLHRPEWPAAELVLNLLGKLLIQIFSNKQSDISLRVASLDYLGLMAARLRKDAIAGQSEDDVILDEIVRSLTPLENDAQNGQLAACRDKSKLIQTALIDYLVELKENDPILEFARQYNVAQWYKDLVIEQERTQKTKKGKDLHSHDFSDAKTFVLSLVDRNVEEFYGSKLQQRAPPLKDNYVGFVIRWLARKRPLSQSFDIYLTQILRVLNESAVAIRSKAMKCLSNVVEADPEILARPDVHRGVHCRLLDTSSNVREVAVDLLGKFVTAKPELIEQYYPMIVERILDTGVSVRKRVIKILRDICEKRPEFEKNAEICVRMLRRMNDEESVRKLVCETFHATWFTPVREKDTPRLLKKVLTISDAVGACAREGAQYDGFEALMTALLCKDPEKAALAAAKQIVNCLVENVLTLDEKLVDSGNDRTSNHQRMLYCLTTLYLFAKVKPVLMVEHAQTMQPYLSMSCNTQGEQAVLIQVIKILEMVVPLMDHPSETFLSQIEDTLLKLASKSGQNVVQASISCLGAILNKLTKNWQKVSLLFQRYLATLSRSKEDLDINADRAIRPESRPQILRSLFTIGLLCQHFDFDSFAKKSTQDQMFWNDQAFSLLIYFINSLDEDVRLKAFASLGYFCTNHPAYLLNEETKRIYLALLADPNADVKLKVQVLRNIENFLREEECKMTKSYKEWDKEKRKEDLKEMGDVASGQGSSVIQHYLKDVLESYFHTLISVRFGVCNVVVLTLQQGLVHPVQCIPHVIAMCTDTDAAIKLKAENILKEIDTKYSGFVQMKAYEGVKMSFKLQQLLVELAPPSNKKGAVGVKLARGLRAPAQDQCQALNVCVYSLLRSVRQQRRGFLKNLLQSFDEISNVCLEELIYVADNVASFPYQTLDEPLFVMHSIDLTVSVTGASLLQAFEEALIPSNKCANDSANDVDDAENVDEIYARLPQNIVSLEGCIKASRGCVLLLILKQYLKDAYGINDSKIQEYLPSEPAKTYDKAVTKKSCHPFDPKYVVDFLQTLKNFTSEEDARRILCKRFIEVTKFA